MQDQSSLYKAKRKEDLSLPRCFWPFYGVNLYIGNVIGRKVLPSINTLRKSIQINVERTKFAPKHNLAVKLANIVGVGEYKC